tara:strand:+ start:2272 stop:3099 length:828 start_codon:yes stop_codon:yes gene_type:complete
LKSVYEDDFEKKYMIWVEQLGKIINNKFYNLIISDNLVSPLQFNSNCILFGSFLWHDIVKKTNENRNVFNFEKQLFRKTRPIIYGMKNFIMPEIMEYGDFREFPSLVEKFKPIYKKKNINHKLFITSGKSGDLLQKYKQIAIALNQNSNLEVAYDPAMRGGLINENFFDYSDKSFSDLSAIIARPGIGIITDSIRYNIPIIVDLSYENKEIEHNALKINKLGIGKRLNFDSKKSFVKDILNFLEDKKSHDSVVNKLKNFPDGGASLIADSIIEKL